MGGQEGSFNLNLNLNLSPEPLPSNFKPQTSWLPFYWEYGSV